MGLCWLGLWGGLPDFPLHLCYDDAFYYFKIAQNMVLNKGSTFDGINLTNGYHPLWLWLCTAFFALQADPEKTVRALFALQIALWGWNLWRIKPTTHLGATVVLLVGAGPAIAQSAINGLESGLVAVMHISLLMGTAPTAGLLVLAFLSRTDAILMLPYILLNMEGHWKEKIKTVLPVSIVLICYLAYNQWQFGTPMQISGAIKRLPFDPLRSAGFLLLASLPYAWAASLSPQGAFPQSRAFLIKHRWYVGFVGASTGYYLFLQAFPQLWYFLPAVILGLGVLGRAINDLEAQAQAEGSNLRLLAAVLLLPLLGLDLYQLQRLTDPEHASAARHDRDVARQLAQLLPPHAIAGSWDSGIIGFYSSIPIINLDGLVNSLAYQQAAATGQAGSFLRKQGMNYLVNHTRLQDGQANTMQEVAKNLLGEIALNKIYQQDFVYTGASNREGPGRYQMATLVMQVAWPPSSNEYSDSPPTPNAP